MNKTYDIKPEINIEDEMIIVPKMAYVWAVFLSFAEMHNLPVLVTNISHKFPQSKSNTHPEGRAKDVRTISWPRPMIKKCVDYMTKKVGHMGAVSIKTKKPRVIYWHDAGLGEHFHIQVSRGPLWKSLEF